MPTTYEPISTQTLGTASASITFNSIPQTYTDLVLVGSVSATANLDYWYRLNSDTGSNYSNTRLAGDGSSVSTARTNPANQTYFNILGTGTGQHNFILHLFNYANTTTHKTQLFRYDNAATATVLRVGLFRSTAAISTVLIQTDSSTFTVGSTFTLYGIKAA